MTHSHRIPRLSLVALMACGALTACADDSGDAGTTPEPSPTEIATEAGASEAPSPEASPEPDASSESEATPEGEPTSEAESPSPTTAPTVHTVAMLEDLWATTNDQEGVCDLWRAGDFRTMLRDYGDDYDFLVVVEHYADRCSGGPDGSRQDPFPIDTVLTGGDWEIAITDVNLDATAIVSAENQFNDPPGSGYQYVMINVELSYDGAEEPVRPWRLLDFAIVGSQGNTFRDSCGVIPAPLRDVGDMYAGATASGNVCISAATEQLEGATLRIALGRGEPAFLSLPTE